MNPDTIQQIFNSIVLGCRGEWTNLEVRHKADDIQSTFWGDFETPTGSERFDIRLLPHGELDKIERLLGQLRDEVAELAGEPFTHCTLHFTKDGDFNIDYSYDPLDWSLNDDGTPSFPPAAPPDP